MRAYITWKKTIERDIFVSSVEFSKLPAGHNKRWKLRSQSKKNEEKKSPAASP